jgi:hypothetical protein
MVPLTADYTRSKMTRHTVTVAIRAMCIQLLHDIQGLHLEVWASIRILDERHNLLLLVAGHAAEAGQIAAANGKREQVAAMDRHISQLKLLLSKLTHLLPVTGTDG